LVVAHLNITDILQVYRSPVLAAADNEELQFVDRVAANSATQLIVAVCNLDRSAALLLENVRHSRSHLPEWNTRLCQQGRKQSHLELLFQAADRSNLSHSRHAL
jgi:hypothetical protein